MTELHPLQHCFPPFKSLSILKSTTSGERNVHEVKVKFKDVCEFGIQCKDLGFI